MFSDKIIRWEEHVAWFRQMEERRHILFFICEYQCAPLGVVNFSRIDAMSRSAHWGFYLGPESNPPGSGLMLGFLGLSHAFAQLEFKKIIGEVLASNPRSATFHRKLGFAEDVSAAASVLKGGLQVNVQTFVLEAVRWFAQLGDLEERALASFLVAGDVSQSG